VVKSNKPRILVLVGDLHVGSTVGVLTEGFITHEGNEVKQNPIQKWMSGAWDDCMEFKDNIVGNDDFAIAWNGDLIDGNHHGTKEIWSVNEADHMNAAVEFMKPLSRAAHSVYITEGTESHTKNAEHAIAKILQGMGINVITPKGKGAWESLALEIAGTIVELDHHMPTSMRSYLEASALSIMLGDVRNQRARAGARCPDVIIRSHRHRFGLYEDGYGMALALPAWQALTRFGRKVVPGAMPQVGIVILDWRNVEDGGTPVVHKRLHTIKSRSPISI
jgi:hypothetical protein